MSEKKAEDKHRGVYEKNPGSGIWWIRWQDERGKIRRKKVGKKSHAKAAVEQMRARVRLGAIAPELVAGAERKKTLAEVMAHVLQTSKVSPRHHKHEIAYTERWNKEFPGLLAEEVTPPMIDQWIARRTREGVKPSTINHQLSFLSKVFKAAVRAEWVAKNPCKMVDRPIDKARRTRFFSEEEIQRIRVYLCYHFNILAWWAVELLILTGLRRGELFAIGREDVDLEHKILILPMTKGGGVQYVQLNDDAVEVFRQLLSAHDSPWAFPGPQMKGPIHPQNFYNRVYKPTLKALGIEDATLHTTRHTTASHLAIRGSTTQEIRDALRHSSTAMAERYAHLNDEVRAKTAQRLNGVTGTGTSTNVSRPQAVAAKRWKCWVRTS